MAAAAPPTAHPRFVSPTVLMRNHELVSWTRTLMTIISGLITGICGLTGYRGALAFLAFHALVSLALLARIRKPSDFFPATTVLSFAAGSVGENALLFVVFWALGFAGLWVF